MATLKEQALLEQAGQLTIFYENRIADLRVEFTNLNQELQELRNQRTDPPGEVLEGNIVQ